MKPLPKSKLSFSIFLFLVPFFGCDKNNDLMLFSIKNDKELGQKMASEIKTNTDEYPILSRTEYEQAYAYLDGMIQHILEKGDISYRNEFAWEVNIIDKDIKNAFVTPGGYIYVYNGLIQYLDYADDLAGVLGHEIAHADQRHSSKQLQQQYGISLLLQIILGENPGTLKTLVSQLAGKTVTLKFSRDKESEADEYSVKYLAQTRYACNGAATFFQKLLDTQSGNSTPEFLSTHPSPDTRVEDINKLATDLSCSTTKFQDNKNTSGETDYTRFKNNWLPK